MAGQLHRHGARHAGPLQTVYCRPPEVMYEPATNTCALAGRAPGCVVLLDDVAASMKHVLDLAANLLLDLVGALPLPIEHVAGLCFSRKVRGTPITPS